jgi:hypothetical protein
MAERRMAITEILPGVYHWTARHPKHGFMVSSYWLEDGGVAIDPLLPEPPPGGIEWFEQRGTPPVAVVLCNRHHYRDSGAFNERFNCPIIVPRPGLHEFSHGEQVTPYDPGDLLPGGVLAVEVGALSPDDGGLYLEPLRALWLADTVVRGYTSDSRPGFVLDSLMDDPPKTKRGLLRALASVLDSHEVENVLLAHGEPMIGDGGARLRELIAAGGRTADSAFA